MTIQTKPFDAAKYLTNPDDQADLLADAIKSGDHSYITVAEQIVARARRPDDAAELK